MVAVCMVARSSFVRRRRCRGPIVGWGAIALALQALGFGLLGQLERFGPIPLVAFE